MPSERELRLRYADLLRGDDDPHLLRLIGDLHRVSQTGVVSEELVARIERTYTVRFRAARHLATRRAAPRRLVWITHRHPVRGERGRQARRTSTEARPHEEGARPHEEGIYPCDGKRLTSRLALAISVLVVMLGAFLSPHALPPSPVSAQVLIRQAAFTHLPSNEALHLVYRSWGGGETGTEDMWQAWNRQGTLARASFQEQDRADGTIVTVTHTVQSGGEVREYRYLPASLVVFVSSYPVGRLASGLLGRENLATGAGVARILTRLRRHPRSDARLLPDRTLEGVPVRVVRVTFGQNDPAATLYIDAHSYLLRGVDGGIRAGRLVTSLRLVEDQVVPVTAMPRGVFRLSTEGLTPVPEP